MLILLMFCVREQIKDILLSSYKEPQVNLSLTLFWTYIKHTIIPYHIKQIHRADLAHSKFPLDCAQISTYIL